MDDLGVLVIGCQGTDPRSILCSVDGYEFVKVLIDDCYAFGNSCELPWNWRKHESRWRLNGGPVQQISCQLSKMLLGTILLGGEESEAL